MMMTTVMINDKSRIGRRLLKDIEQHPRVARIVDDAFEQDWRRAVSGDELVKRAHRHIDELYAQVGK
ncbi:MAG: hypothetical protein LBR08_11870 [Bacteroidales bacterium]|jgi:hypothetical protein|nr:hypothetical protein [Bacteroidales bacterium]